MYPLAAPVKPKDTSRYHAAAVDGSLVERSAVQVGVQTCSLSGTSTAIKSPLASVTGGPSGSAHLVATAPTEAIPALTPGAASAAGATLGLIGGEIVLGKSECQLNGI